MKTTVNQVLIKVDELNYLIEVLRKKQDVDLDQVADNLEEYLDLLRKLPVEI
jgi:hypothetical protein